MASCSKRADLCSSVSGASTASGSELLESVIAAQSTGVGRYDGFEHSIDPPARHESVSSTCLPSRCLPSSGLERKNTSPAVLIPHHFAHDPLKGGLNDDRESLLLGDVAPLGDLEAVVGPGNDGEVVPLRELLGPPERVPLALDYQGGKLRAVELVEAGLLGLSRRLEREGKGATPRRAEGPG